MGPNDAGSDAGASASSGMFSNTKDAEFAQRIMQMRQREQDGLPDELSDQGEPDEDAKGDEPSVEAEDEDSKNKNFMTRLYEDESFQHEKLLLEEQIMKASMATAESKSFIHEMDDFLKDLKSWKSKRDDQLTNPAIPEEEIKAA